MQIRIFQIKINPGRREADPEAVHKLADSISKVGLINPITVDQEYTLIAGLHRLEAARMLGWAEIECTVSDLDGLLAQLAEIDENLIRREFDQVEEWEQLARRKEIYEKLHPETKNGGDRKYSATRTSKCRSGEAKPFVQDTAEKLGVSRRTVERAIETAKNLTPKAKKVIQSADKKFSKTDALKLSRLPPDQQEDAARQLASKAIRSVDEYHSTLTAPEEITPEQEEPQGVGQAEPVSAPPALPSLGTGYYATTKDSVDDLKNPDKDRTRTLDSFLMTFTFFLQRFCAGIANYDAPEYDVVFPLLTKDQLEQLRHEIQSVHTALDDLFHKMERMAQK